MSRSRDPVAIAAATFRDVCFVAAHMRRRDRREIFCQLADGATSRDVAAWCCLDTEHAYCAWYRGSPVAAFGVSPASLSGTVWSAWAFGTARLKRAVPRISRYGVETIAPELVRQGVRRVEARSLADHASAHRWLARLGARRDGELRAFGKNGETFILWSWTCAEWRKTHVLQDENTETSRPPQGPEPAGG